VRARKVDILRPVYTKSSFLSYDTKLGVVRHNF
jgi:hypothetical protein